MTDDGAGHPGFALTSPGPAPRASRRGYSDGDHQWLILLCSRYITLKAFRRLVAEHKCFKDYPELLRAAVIYFGHTELGWILNRIEKHIGHSRRFMGKAVADIEAMRHGEEGYVAGDVFDQIEIRIKGVRSGAL